MQSRYKHFIPPGPAIESRIDGMIARLSLRDKIDLLGGAKDQKGEGGDTVKKPKAGIPAFKMADASVGIHWWTEASTTYPATIALASSFNKGLAYEAGKAIGRDARARGIHILLGPGVNLYRSPLCGRNFEYLGEDPVLAAGMATGFIRGCQDQGVAATVKHFALNNQEYDRNHTSSDADERTLRELYLQTFEAAVREAGVGAVMTSYNPVNGVHASEHDGLIRGILKGEWGFDGMVMSDWVSVYSTVNAANAGLDLEMPNARWFSADKLLPTLRDGLVTEAVIDDKIRRLLRLAICFGWLDHEQKDDSIPLDDPDTAAVSLEIAREGSVLLKNEGNILPLSKTLPLKIAVVGPMGHPAVLGGGGSSHNKPWHAVSVLDGIKAQVPGADVQYVEGVRPDRDAVAFRNTAYTTATGEPGMLATYFNTTDFSGAVVRTVVERVNKEEWFGGDRPIAEGVDKANFSVRWSGFICPEESGDQVFYLRCWDGCCRLVVDGDVLIDRSKEELLGTVRARKTLEAGQRYSVVVEYSRVRWWNLVQFGYEPASRLEAEVAAATALARECDVVVFCGGFCDRTEMEGVDREFAMPPEQESLLAAVTAVNPRTIAVITAGGNIDMSRWGDKVAGILYAWYPGQEGGRAVAEILFGDVNPSGRLPATFEERLEDRSSFACYHAPSGERRVPYSDGVFTGYRHVDRSGIAPRYPFGFGLSYTQFEYRNLVLSGKSMEAGGRLVVSCDIVNTGKRAGGDVVQLYIRDEIASQPRPFKELKQFEKVFLQPGEQQTVSFVITERDLRYFDPDRSCWVVEPGCFKALLGASSADIRLTGSFEVV